MSESFRPSAPHSSLPSLRQSLGHPSDAGAAGRPRLQMRLARSFPGPVSSDGGGSIDPVPDYLWAAPDSLWAAPDQVGQYQIPGSIKGGIYYTLMDSGCNQTSIHQSIMQQRALNMSRKVKMRCVQEDVMDYHFVRVSIQFRGKNHSS